MTEQEFLKTIEAAKAEYHEMAQADAPSKAELAKLSAIIKDSQDALSALIADGANDCVCGVKAIGMIRGTKRVTPDFSVTVYEVGCASCAFVNKGQGTTPAEAVANWNAAIKNA